VRAAAELDDDTLGHVIVVGLMHPRQDEPMCRVMIAALTMEGALRGIAIAGEMVHRYATAEDLARMRRFRDGASRARL
jgi:hypothetical protein